MKQDSTKPLEATPVYAALETEDGTRTTTATARTDLMGGPSSSYHHYQVSEAFRHIPEARNLTWTDDFFEDDDDVVAVFDLDYDAAEDFYTSVGWVTYGLTLLYAPIFAIATIALLPCYLRKNISWSVRARHVAITRDGIRVVDNRRPCGWGLACCDSGKKSKTVPFDKITDCDIVEPAGNQCICIPRVLFNVHIDTASSSSEHHELVLAGLQDPHSFKKLVWAMKRAQQQNQLPNTNNHHTSLDMMRAMPSLVAHATTATADNSDDNNIATLLREIRDELRQNNETLQAMKNSQQVGATVISPSAPEEPEEGRFV